jgi:hypothetical protein
MEVLFQIKLADLRFGQKYISNFQFGAMSASLSSFEAPWIEKYRPELLRGILNNAFLSTLVSYFFSGADIVGNTEAGSHYFKSSAE